VIKLAEINVADLKTDCKKTSSEGMIKDGEKLKYVKDLALDMNRNVVH
jgi:hypothetical protein